MLRKVVLTIIIIIVLTSIYYAGRATRILIIYEVPFHEMQPNYVPKDWIVASKLKSLSYNDVICFTPPGTSSKNNIAIQRVVGFEGDSIEINDGYLIRNGFMADAPEKLMFNYLVKRKVVKNIKVFDKLQVKPVIVGDTITLCLTYKDYQYLGREYLLRKFNKPRTQKDPNIFGSTDQNGWNISNYGPFVVPKGFCFVLGDNRHNARDSRFLGCIPLQNILGIAICPR
jgi:signal peptidase I